MYKVTQLKYDSKTQFLDGISIKMHQEFDKIKKIAEVSTVFTPSQPITIRELFAGRYSQIKKARETIFEPGAHAVIYGDRGIGKTSLANTLQVIIDLAENNELICTKVDCDPYDSFSDLWIKSFSKILITTEEESIKLGFNEQEKQNSQNKITNTVTLSQKLGWNLSTQNIKTSEITDAIQRLSKLSVFIFDEFDRLKVDETKEKMTSLIKSLSDNCSTTTVIIIGIAENIIELVRNHQSIERCLKQIYLPRMSKDELVEIIDTGLNHLELKIENNIQESVIHFAEGFPQFVHLLMKRSVISAINAEVKIIKEEHFQEAVCGAISDTQETVRDAYYKAVITTKAGVDNFFREVLIACAFTETDEYGTFQASDVQKALLKTIGKDKSRNSYAYNLGKLCEEERGEILNKIYFGKQFRFRFKNPITKAFVKLKAYELGIFSNFDTQKY